MYFSFFTLWGTPATNSNIQGKVNGSVKIFNKGISIHANGKVTYDLSGKDYDNFEALVGVNYASIAQNNNSSITFKVIGDGKTLATTNVIKYADDMICINVPIKGVNTLEIQVNDGGNGNSADHTSFGDAKLYTIKDEDADYSSLEELVLSVNEYDKYLYTFESFEVLEEALNKANTILEDRISSQLEVNQMIEELNEAIENLELDLNKVVDIKDRYLKASIKSELKLSNDNITVGDMTKLTKLDVQGAESLDGLQYAKNLEYLNIEYNEIKDLSPLKNLKKLTNLKVTSQMIVGGEVSKKDNKVTIDYDVLNRKGEKLSPISIIVRNNKTLQDTTLNIEECLDEKWVISFDTTNFDKYVHSVYLAYEDTNDNYQAQVLFIFNNR